MRFVFSKDIANPCMIVYVILPYDEWQAFKATGKADACAENHSPVYPWLRRQIAERTGARDAADVRPVFAWLSRPPSRWMWPPKRAVLKVRVADELVVPIDEDAYIGVLNAMGNGWVDETTDPENMFDVSTSSSDVRRAFVAGPITRQMVRKAWVFRWSTRLRRKTRALNG